MTTCRVCELHAESIFKIEGMDCHEEVAILERSLKRLSGLEALDADVMGQRLRVSYDAAGAPVVFDRVFIPGDRFRITRELSYASDPDSKGASA